MANVQRGWLDLEEVATIRVTEDKAKALELVVGDILFNEGGDRDKLGRGWVWNGEIERCIHQNHVFRARLTTTDLLPEFVSLFANSVAQPWFEAAGKQTTNLASLNLSTLKSLPIPVPPRAEQRQIISDLERRFSRVDAGRRYLAEAEGGLRRLRTVILNSIIAGATSWVPLGDLLDVPLSNGKSVRTREGGFPVLRLTALRDGTVITSESKPGDWSREVALRYLVREGDFLIARGNGSLRLVGRGALVASTPPQVAFPDTMIRARPDESRLLARYLRCVWDSPAVRSQIEASARTTAGIYKVNQEALRSVQVPLISLTSQRAVVADYERRLSLIQAAEKAASVNRIRSASLKMRLAVAACTGSSADHQTRATKDLA